MIIVMKSGATKREKEEVLGRIKELGYKPHVIHGTTRDVIGAVGDERGKQIVIETIESMHGVESVVPILKAYKLASKEVKKESSIIQITDSLSIGGRLSSWLVLARSRAKSRLSKQLLQSSRQGRMFSAEGPSSRGPLRTLSRG